MNSDRARQIFVTLSMAFCIFGTLLGTGVIGTRVEESSGGSLSADATLIAPAAQAFSIWSVIYAGLVAYTVWQWLPRQTDSPRNRSVGWLAGLSMILNAAWLLVTQFGWLWVSVGVIAALALVLGLIARRLTQNRAESVLEGVLVDGTFGLYLGWVAVATCANVAATIVAGGVEAAGGWQTLITVLLLLVVIGLGFLFQGLLGRRVAVALAMAWGLSWIGVGRLVDEPESLVVAVVAIMAALVLLAAALIARVRSGSPLGYRLT